MFKFGVVSEFELSKFDAEAEFCSLKFNAATDLSSFKVEAGQLCSFKKYCSFKEFCSSKFKSQSELCSLKFKLSASSQDPLNLEFYSLTASPQTYEIERVDVVVLLRHFKGQIRADAPDDVALFDVGADAHGRRDLI